MIHRRRHDGPMDNPTVISDPETGESLCGGPNTPEACARGKRDVWRAAQEPSYLTRSPTRAPPES